MNQYFLVRYRQTGTAALRDEKRGEHIAYRKGLGEGLVMAGPILDESGVPIGSVIILAADDRAQAKQVASADPFVLAELLTIETVEPIRIAALRPVASA